MPFLCIVIFLLTHYTPHTERHATSKDGRVLRRHSAVISLGESYVILIFFFAKSVLSSQYNEGFARILLLETAQDDTGDKGHSHLDFGTTGLPINDVIS